MSRGDAGFRAAVRRWRAEPIPEHEEVLLRYLQRQGRVDPVDVEVLQYLWFMGQGMVTIPGSGSGGRLVNLYTRISRLLCDQGVFKAFDLAIPCMTWIVELYEREALNVIEAAVGFDAAVAPVDVWRRVTEFVESAPRRSVDEFDWAVGWVGPAKQEVLEYRNAVVYSDNLSLGARNLAAQVFYAALSYLNLLDPDSSILPPNQRRRGWLNSLLQAGEDLAKGNMEGVPDRLGGGVRVYSDVLRTGYLERLIA